MSPSINTVLGNRKSRIERNLAAHPAVVAVTATEDGNLEALTRAGRLIRVHLDAVPQAVNTERRVSLTVAGCSGYVRRPSYDEALDATRLHRAVNQVLGRTVATTVPRTIAIGDGTLEELLGFTRQFRHAGDHAGHPIPLQTAGLRLQLVKTRSAEVDGESFEVLLAADGTVSCHGPLDPYPEVTEAWLAVVDRNAGLARGTVRAALAQLAEQVFSDPDVVAVTG